MPSAVERVFGIQELFEQILDNFLESCDEEPDKRLTVLTLQRVNKTFRDAISGSTHLRRQVEHGPPRIHTEYQSIAAADKVAAVIKKFGMEHHETRIDDPTAPRLIFYMEWKDLELPCQPGTWRELKLLPRPGRVIVELPYWGCSSDSDDSDEMYFDAEEATLGVLVDRMEDDWARMQAEAAARMAEREERFKNEQLEIHFNYGEHGDHEGEESG